MAQKRLNFFMDESLVSEVDSLASSLRLSRTAIFSLIVAKFFEDGQTLTLPSNRNGDMK